MNAIKCLPDKSDYEIYDDYVNFQVDGYWLDEKLDKLYPGHLLKGTVPTLLFWMEIEQESEIVWNRILPDEGQKTICPILMCPDDADFSCTLIVAEIENSGTLIKWNRMGIDQTANIEPERIGSTVTWFDKVEALEFSIDDYKGMLNEFKRHFERSRKNWEEPNQKTQEEQKYMNDKRKSWFKRLWS